MIEELTEAQRAKFPEYVEKWTAVGLSTAPADRKRAEEGVRRAYINQGLTPPRWIVWTGSPKENGIFVFINNNAKLSKEITEKVKEIDSMSEKTDVLDVTGLLEWWNSIPKTDEIERKMKDAVHQSVNDSGFGQHDADDMAFFSFFRNECGLVEDTEKYVTGIGEIVQSAGWWIPYAEACIICDRMGEIHMDEENQLHNEDGAALKYRDGFSLYMVHGIRIPDYVIERPNEITAQKINDEESVEVRRVMLDKFGWDRYLLESNASVIDKSEWGVLYHQPIQEDEDCVMVRLLNASAGRYGNLTKDQALEVFGEDAWVNESRRPSDIKGFPKNTDVNPEKKSEMVRLKDWHEAGKLHDYFIRVPPTTKTAKEAVAWMAFFDASQYSPEVQT
jgi:hypothetical protein